MERSTVRLSDLCNLVTEQVNPSDQPDAVYVGLEHITPGQFVRKGQGKASDVRSSKVAFKSGDILYGKLRPYLDKAVLAQDEGICTTELLILRNKAGVDPRFLAGVVHSPNFVEYAVAGTTGAQHPRTSWSHICTFSLLAFTPDEQKRIADILWLLHEGITASENSVETGKDLKRSAMHRLFTRGLRGEAQKETELGPVPESWRVLPLARVVLLKRGFDLPLSRRQSGDIPVLGSNGVVGYHNESPADIPIPGVLVGRSGSVGRVSFTTEKYWPLNTALFATDFFGNDANFISYFLDNFDFSRFAQGVSVPTLNRNSFADVPVAIPPVNEQRQLASILEAIDRKIDLHRRKRAALDDLFKALLHKLMTGEIRVGELDLSALGPPGTPAFALQNGRSPFQKTLEGDQP